MTTAQDRPVTTLDGAELDLRWFLLECDGVRLD
jgi:hypothetical protein